MQRTIDLSPAEPARIGFAQPRGAKFNCSLQFRRAGPAATDLSGANPQLILRPRSRSGAQGYDIAMTSADTGEVEIDGAALQDPNGYTVELYARDDNLRPTELLASGAMVMTGGAYAYSGPFGPMTLPVVAGPAGPAGSPGGPGIQGPAGTRGSMWFSGHGAPSIIGEVVGDMYLDVDSGDVWRWGGLGSWERA